MTREFIHVYRVCNTDYVNPHNGYGSTMRDGGRWNTKYPCIYTGANRLIAQLEWVSHALINEFDFPSLTIITYAIPKDQIFAIDITKHAGWINDQSLTKQLGDKFLSQKRYIALCVPSAMDYKELNYILNPSHLEFLAKDVVINDNEALILNQRFFEVKEFVKKALKMNEAAKLIADAKLAKYTSEDSLQPVFKRLYPSRSSKK